MVQILTHTREKLVFVEKMRESLKTTVDGLDSTIQGFRGEINTTKEACEKLRLEIQDAKQETEIVNSQELVVDFKKRAQNITRIEEEISAALDKEKEMKTVIEMYQRKIRKEGLVKWCILALKISHFISLRSRCRDSNIDYSFTLTLRPVLIGWRLTPYVRGVLLLLELR